MTTVTVMFEGIALTTFSIFEDEKRMHEIPCCDVCWLMREAKGRRE